MKLIVEFIQIVNCLSHFFLALHYVSSSSHSFITQALCKPWKLLRKQWGNFVSSGIQEFCGLSSNLALFDCSTLHSSLSLSVFPFLSFFFFVQIVRFLLAASWKFNKFSPSPMNVAFNAYSSLTRLSLRFSMFYFLAFLLSLLMLSFISFN